MNSSNPIILNSVANGGGRLSAGVGIDGRESELYFQVEQHFREHLNEKVADCFVVALLYRAVREGRDIESAVPVSERLLYQLNTYLTRVLCGLFGQRTISIRAPVAADEKASGRAVGTGLTCGIDSLYTIASYAKTPYPGYDLTHLALFNVGSHDRGKETEAEMFGNRRALAEGFCEESGYPLVIIDSNVKSFLPYPYAEYYCLANCAAVLVLQRLWRIYYSSSSYPVRQFRFTASALSHFEPYILDALSTEATKLYCAGSEVARFEKTRRIVDFAPSHKYLNVCNHHSQNCGECVKCLRTLYALDILGALDRYREVFNVDKYRKQLDRHLGSAYARLRLARDPYIKELYGELRKKHRISTLAKCGGALDFVRSRLRMYSWRYIRYRFRDAGVDKASDQF
jgi:hypothetical protein